jgi:hypothetical protein
MSSPTVSSSGALKWVTGTLGIVLLLGALAGFAYTGNQAWHLWQKTHPKVAAGKPAAGTNALPRLGNAGTATNGIRPVAKPPAVQIPVDVFTKMGAWFMGEIIALFLAIRLLQMDARKPAESAVTTVTSARPLRHASNRRWQSCNVLQIGPDLRRLWNFGAGKGGFSLNGQQSLPVAQPLPANLVGRDWKLLFQPRLNIAWLPVDQVFLRVVQLPVSDLDETLAMVELQLEKLSPLPVTQIVWSVQMLPQKAGNLQSVIVIMMGRDLVEKFLGDLEGQGYLADRLELPVLDELLTTPVAADGAYIYPDRESGKLSALVAWWYGGILHNLGLLRVPAVEGRDALLREQLTQMAWAGELEGWLAAEPRWHLVADEATAANWQPMFRPWLGQPVEVLAPLTEAQLAVANANRAARSDFKTGILPVEYATRYRQEFIDRLWMRSVGAVLAVYAFAVVIYMAGAQWQGMKTQDAMADFGRLSREYTNTLQFKAQLEILQNRQALKFASLDCWKVTAESLPENITVQSMEFKDGKHFSLSGSAPAEQRTQVTDFYERLRKATLHDQVMFEKLTPPEMKLQPGGTAIAWSFGGDLARAEESK